MPRSLLIRSNFYPYHVTGRANNREQFHAHPELVWRIFCDYLVEAKELYQLKVHAFVLMPNHFHLIVTTPKDDLGVVMQWFISSVTRTLNQVSSRSGRVFGAKYFRSLIDNLNYFDIAMKYVYRNPVKAALVEKVEHYKFSTLNSISGDLRLKLKIEPAYDFPTLIPSHGSWKEYLGWMNQPFKSEDEERIQQAFRRRVFKLSRSGWKRSPTKPHK